MIKRQNDMAPVIIFAFNRLDALINVITSLLLNEEAQESDLFVFVDGAREGKVVRGTERSV